MMSPLTEQLLQYTVPIGIGLAAFVLALVVGILKFLKENMSNGDGRSLRKAVDDLADDFKEHREETRSQHRDLAGRMEHFETRMERVEGRSMATR